MSYPTFDFVAGPYSGTLGGSALGAPADGWRIRKRHMHEPIKTDWTGEVAVDGINMGTEYEIEVEGLEFEKIKAAMNRHSDDGDTQTNIGSLQTSLAQALVLTALVASAKRPTFTATKAICETDVDFMLSKGLKRGRVVFHLYPDPTTGKAYSLT